MSKEKVKKDTHQCSVCGRLSTAKSVLRETKDEKTGVISYFCTNQKKCKEDKKAGNLVNGKRKIVRVKKEAKKSNGKKSKKLEKKIDSLKSIINEEEATAKEAQATA